MREHQTQHTACLPTHCTATLQEGEEHIQPIEEPRQECVQGQQADEQQDPEPGAAPGL